MKTAPTLLTTEQVAVRLGKSVATVNRMALDGRLEAAYQLQGVRGPRLYLPGDVLAYLQGGSNDDHDN